MRSTSVEGPFTVPSTSISALRLAARWIILALALKAVTPTQGQTSYTWNGSASSAWNNAVNWTPSTGFPLAADHATIVAAANTPQLDMSRSVTNLTMNGGSLDLNGFTLTSTGTGSLNGGSMNNGTYAPATAGITNFAGTVFGGSVNGTTGVLQFAGSTFNGPVILTKTGGGNDYSSGSTVFNTTATFTVTAGRLYLANTGTTAFNGDVVVNSTGTSGGVWMGQNTGILTLASGRTFAAGTFTMGSLLFRNFNQVGNTPQTILLGGASTLYFQAGSVFNGTVSAASSGLYLNGTTFNADARFVKTGSTNEYSGGGNTWQASCEFTSTGPGILYLANTGSDQYNGDLLVNSTGTGGIIFGNSGGTSTLAAGHTISVGSTGYPSGYLHLRGFSMPGTTAQSLVLGSSAIYGQFPGFQAGGDISVTAGSILLNGGTVNGIARYVKNGSTNDWGTGGCVFNDELELWNNGTGILGPCNTGVDTYNGNIRVSNTNIASIRFGNGTGSGTLAAGKTITVGAGGYSSGLFLMEHFIQVGSTPQTMTFGSAVEVYIRSACSFGGPLTISAGGFHIDSSIFSGDCRFTKTGSGGETSNGGNTFQGDLELVNASTGQFYFADNIPDAYGADVIVSNTSTGQIRFGNGSTGGGTIAPGGTLSVGSGGFDNGLLLLRSIIQSGPTPQSLTLGPNASLYIYPGCSWDGDFTASAGSFYLNQSTYNGMATFIKTGGGNDGSQGGNVFAGNLDLTNVSTGAYYMAQTYGDTYNGDIVVNNLSSGQIRFGSTGATTSTLAPGRTITVGSGGFEAGLLLLRGFVQLGATPQSIVTGPLAGIYFYPNTVFNGDVATSSGSVLFYSATFNGTGHFIKNDATADVSQGGCTFNGDIEFEITGGGSIYLAENFGDTYNGNVLVSNVLNGQFRIGSAGVTTSTLSSGRTLSVGAGGFNAGVMLLRGLLQVGATAQSLQLGPLATLYFYPGSVFDGDMVAQAGGLYFYGTTFNGTGTFTKTGNGGEGSQGGCVFNATTEFILTGAGNLSLDYTGSDLFNGDILVNCTSSGQINFGQSGGSATLAAGRSITVGATGFDTGSLILRNFNQSGATPQVLALGSTAGLYYYPGTVFNGNVVSTSGTLYFSGTTFNGTGKFTKTGPSGDGSQGNCVFNGQVEFINANTGNLSLDYTGVDAFNGDVVLNSTSTGQINFGQNGGTATLAAGRTITVGGLGFNSGSLYLRNFIQIGGTPQNLPLGPAAGLYYYPGTVFNGSLVSTSGTLYFYGSTFNSTGKFSKSGPSGDGSQGGCVFNGFTEFFNTGTGNLSLDYTGVDAFNGDVQLSNTTTGQINFGQNGGSATLAAGRTITTGSLGFNTGLLYFRNFTQTGTTPQNLILGNGTSLYFQTGNTFNGDLVTTSGALFLNGTIFNGAAKFTKNGPSGDGSVGGNIYNGPTEFIVNSVGNLSLDQTLPDQFNNNVLVNCTANGIITTGQGTGSATLAAGRTIGVGSLGFNTGTLQLKNFTQVGSTPQTLLLGNAATMSFQANNVFGGNVTTSAGSMLVSGTVFNGTGWFRKTNTGSSVSAGGNTFNGDVELVNTSGGVLFMNNTVADVYNGELLLNSTGAGGINFGNSTGTATLTTGSVNIGSLGFTAGTLLFRNFTKVSAVASSLNGGINTAITFAANSLFNGNITATTGNLLFNGTTFNGNGVFNKTAAGNNASYGGNVFNGDVEINNAGQMSLSVNAPDDYNGNATFRRLGAGTFIPVYNYDVTFSKNVSTLGSTGGSVLFGNSARTIFDGTTVQTFSSDAAAPPTVRNLVLAMTGAGELQLLGNVNVSQTVAFTSGIVKPMATSSTANGLLILANGVTFSDPADNGSHVDGFVRKIGNAAFTFPVGNAGVLAPVTISAPATATHHFTAKYVYEDATPLYNTALHDISLHHVSHCEYWIVDRTNSTTNVTVTLSYDSVRSCGVTSLPDLVVARWNGSTWKDHGQGALMGTLAAGTIATAAPVTAFSPFTLASRSAMNPLPIELVSFSAVLEGHMVRTEWVTASERNNDRFEVERSADGIDFEIIGSLEGAGNSASELRYSLPDMSPLEGVSYYRLKQVDFDGTFTYSAVTPVDRRSLQSELLVFPNPATDLAWVSVPAKHGLNSLVILDMQGRVVLDITPANGTGAQKIPVEVNDLPSGVYLVRALLADDRALEVRLLKP